MAVAKLGGNPRRQGAAGAGATAREGIASVEQPSVWFSRARRLLRECSAPIPNRAPSQAPLKTPGLEPWPFPSVTLLQRTLALGVPRLHSVVKTSAIQSTPPQIAIW